MVWNAKAIPAVNLKKDVFYIRKKIPVYLIINISNDKKSFNMIILD